MTEIVNLSAITEAAKSSIDDPRFCFLRVSFEDNTNPGKEMMEFRNRSAET